MGGPHPEADLSDSTTAVLFPGQGSPPRDMRERVERTLPELAALLYDEVGHDVFDAPEDSQRRLQPALLAAVLSGWTRLRELAERGAVDWQPAGAPLAYAGHSLGEIAALVAAESLAVEAAVRLVHLRGRVVEEALEGDGRGAMVAVIGPGAHEFAQKIMDGEGIWIANDNSPIQVMLSGREPAVEHAAEDARQRAFRVVPMPMKGAGHTPLMAGCLPPYRDALAAVEFRPPRAPVYSGASARPFTDPARELADSLTHTVRFREVLLDLRARGAQRFIDTGPGHVMAGLAHRTLGDVETPTVADLEAA
jgi:malonyl CoA-acyl carrier protein transacylase